MTKTYDLQVYKGGTGYSQLFDLSDFLNAVPDLSVTLTEEIVKGAPPPPISALGPLVNVRVVLDGEDRLLERICAGFEKIYSSAIKKDS